MYDRDAHHSVAQNAGARFEGESQISQNEPNRGAAPRRGSLCARRTRGERRAGRARAQICRFVGWLLLRSGPLAENETVILVDTSVIVPWLDKAHPAHEACS